MSIFMTVSLQNVEISAEQLANAFVRGSVDNQVTFLKALAESVNGLEHVTWSSKSRDIANSNEWTEEERNSVICFLAELYSEIFLARLIQTKGQ